VGWKSGTEPGGVRGLVGGAAIRPSVGATPPVMDGDPNRRGAPAESTPAGRHARPMTSHPQNERNPRGLVSIGYEGRTAAELLRELSARRVRTLVDVRLTPLSRKPGLSKTKLAGSADAAGINYVHLPALGNPKDNRSAFWNGDLETGCVVFEARMASPAAIAALDQLEALARDCLTAVLCFEQDHQRCHRQVVLRIVQDRLGRSAEVIHV
jgi:Protein of unknown function, DUF488